MRFWGNILRSTTYHTSQRLSNHKMSHPPISSNPTHPLVNPATREACWGGRLNAKTFPDKTQSLGSVWFRQRSTWLSDSLGILVESRIIEQCAMSSGISYLGRGVRIAAEKELLSPSESHKKQKKTPDLTRGGNSNDIAHCSIIRDSTVLVYPSESQTSRILPFR